MVSEISLEQEMGRFVSPYISSKIKSCLIALKLHTLKGTYRVRVQQKRFLAALKL